MKKAVFVWLLLGLILTGCAPSDGEMEQMFRSDTVIQIPLNPEETAPAAEETVPETTQEPAQTIPEETAKSSAGTGSSTKASSSKSSSSKSTSQTSSASTGKTTKATEPDVTEVEEAEPPATEIPETQPPETEPPATESPEAVVYDISGYAPGSLEYAVAEQINAYRAEAGLGTLTMSGTLSGVASVRAYEVCLSWSHTRPNGSGWQTVLSDYGVGYSAAAEELVHSAGFDAAAIVSKWMGAESNSTDILNPAYTIIGVGIYSEGGTTFLAAILIG